MQQFLADKNIILGGIEAGGTKFDCVVANSQGDILKRQQIPTQSPDETLAKSRAFFERAGAEHGEIAALGIGSFGPLELNKKSATYGSIKQTPKPHWSDVNLIGYFKRTLNVPIGLETDVNAAALGEGRIGAAQGCSHYAYVTVGTGIGVGVVTDGKLIQGINHPELGHLLIARHPQDDQHISSCPFHHSCVEGLASGSSLNLRFNKGIEKLREDHLLWDIEAHYIAVLCVNITQMFGPQKIILGGGVMQQTHLIPKIRKEFLRLINGYAHESVLQDVANYIVPPGLNGLSGVVGSLQLAAEALIA